MSDIETLHVLLAESRADTAEGIALLKEGMEIIRRLQRERDDARSDRALLRAEIDRLCAELARPSDGGAGPVGLCGTTNEHGTACNLQGPGLLHMYHKGDGIVWLNEEFTGNPSDG